MAKQIGIHGLHGKVNGMSYYSSKNGGMLVRKINEGLGDRVKSSREFVNTRKNNAEFGAAGALAGAIIKAITMRWRFILDSTATGKLNKQIKEGLVFDTTHIWGQRGLVMNAAKAVQARFNDFSKNEMIQSVISGLASQVSYDETTQKITTDGSVDCTVDDRDYLLGLGATGVKFQYYLLYAKGVEFDTAANAYKPAQVSLLPLTGLDVDANNIASAVPTCIGDASVDAPYVPSANTNMLSGVLAVMLPYKTIGGEKNILQQHCAAYWAEIKTAE